MTALAVDGCNRLTVRYSQIVYDSTGGSSDRHGGDVVLGAGVPTEAGDGDCVERRVGACRSPVRLSRRRCVLPAEASFGLTPQRAVKDASVLIRCALSPAARISAAAVSGPTP